MGVMMIALVVDVLLLLIMLDRSW